MPCLCIPPAYTACCRPTPLSLSLSRRWEPKNQNISLLPLYLFEQGSQMKTGFHPLFCAPTPTTLAHPLICQNQSYLAITFNKLLMLSSIQLKTTFIVVMPTYFTRYYYHYHYHTCLNVLSVHLSFFPFYLEPASKTGNHRIYHCPEPASTPGYYLFKLIL